MALYNNPYQYSFGVPGQMNQFQQQPVQMPAQPVQQPQQNNNGILWVSGEVGAKSYLVAPGTSVLLMDSSFNRSMVGQIFLFPAKYLYSMQLFSKYVLITLESIFLP